ncbi:MAG: hypothetical protein LBP67_09645 [Bacteroidales bacterium]|jgi:hypothetical protein|nr:hypothetical protein [Bacteroidales bacterium]
MRKFYNKAIILAFTLFVCLLTSCGYNNPEGIPSYIQIDTAYFNAKYPNIQGSSSSAIVDVWVYVDNQIQGIYELPVVFPILRGGSTNIFLRAGIMDNGSIDSRVYYPFYDKYDLGSVNLIRGEITKIESPTFNYISPDNMTFKWIEDFENYSSSLIANQNSEADMQIATGGEVFEGKFSGKIVLENENTYFEVETSKSYSDLPTNGSAIYLELDYKVGSTIEVGIKATYEGSAIIKYPAIYIVSRDNWRKIYVNLTQLILECYNASYFNIYISGGNADEDTIEKTEFYFDNIKLVY